MTCQLKGSGEIRNEVATTGDVHVRMNVSRGLNQRRWVLRELGRITTDSLRIPIWPQSKKKKKKKKLLIKFYPYRFKLGTQQVVLMYSQV